MDEQPQSYAAAERRIHAAVLGGEQSLSLARLGLETPPGALVIVPTLRVLDLSGNRLVRLPGWFGRLHALHTLDLSGNLLTELPAWISELAALKSLLLSGNKLLDLPDALLQLGSLVRLDLADNQLIEVPAGLAQLPLLEHLDLTGNPHLISPPPAIVAKGSASVLEYLRGPNSARDSALRLSPSDVPPEGSTSERQPEELDAARMPDVSPSTRSSPGVPGATARKGLRSALRALPPLHRLLRLHRLPRLNRLVAVGGAVVLLGAVAFFAAGIGDEPAAPAQVVAAPPGTSTQVSGQVSCTSGKSVVGVWVAAAQGSGFAQWKGLGNGSTADYWYWLPTSEPYSLHVGCGGTPASWAVAANSPQVSGTHNSFNCTDVSGQPGYKTCVTR